MAYLSRMLIWTIILMLLLLSACNSTPTTPAAAAVTPTLNAQAAQGKAIFTRDCATCHSLLEETTIVGPSMAGVASRAADQVPGQDAQTYLMISITRPNDHLVEGYQDLMPNNFGKRLSGEEIDALVAYLMTLE